MHDIEYIMVDIVNSEKKMEELMLEIVNHDEFPQAVRMAVEGSNGNFFARLCNEICTEIAKKHIN